MEQNQTSLKRRTVAGIFWKLLENGGTQGVQFITTIVLARLLDPEHYGVLSITVIFVTLANVFVQRGFALSLVQKKDADETDFSSVFYFTLTLSALLYALLWVAAPWIARYYASPEVRSALRAIAVILFFGAVTSVQNAIIMRELAFRKRFVVSLVSVLLSGAVGITLAYLGKGVWALVAQQIVDNLTMCVGLSMATRWRPRRLFSFQKLGALFSYGWKLLASSLLETLYSDVSGLIIGKRYSTAMLAYYDKGRRFPNYLGTNLTGALQAALFPAFTRAQDDTARLKTMVRRSVATSAFTIFPLIAGLAAVAVPLVRIVLLPKWLPSVPFLQVFCLTFAMYPIDATVLQAINALGRSDVYLKLEIAKKIAGILLIVAAVFWLDTPLALAWALAGTAVLSVALNALPIRRLIGYGYGEQCRDILPSLALSALMGGAVYAVSLLGLSDWATLAVQIPLGACIYVGIAWLTKMDSFYFLLRSLKEFRHKKEDGRASAGEE